MSGLLPCPWCGSKACDTIIESAHLAQCSNRLCHGSRTGWLLVKYWNTRTAQSSQLEEVEALREKCKRYAQYFDDMHGTPCEQIRHAQEVSELRALVGKLVGVVRAANYLGSYDSVLEEAEKVMGE